MPEGPEVESVRRELLSVVSIRVKHIQLTPLSQKYPKYLYQQVFFDSFDGCILNNVLRFGKVLVWRFVGTEQVILNHLGMSGKWCFCEDLSDLRSDITHSKVIIQMEKPPHLIFDDTRNFGQFKIYQTYDSVLNYRPIKSLGIDGLELPFPLEEFIERLTHKRYQDKVIGELLLNQRLVAGVGNIYKAESLHLAGIHPLRKVKSLTKIDIERLGNAISEILQKALKNLGSSTDTRYVLPSGTTGNAQLWHRVYQRKGKPCLKCGSEIEKIIQKDRSTFFCPSCQT